MRKPAHRQPPWRLDDTRALPPRLSKAYFRVDELLNQRRLIQASLQGVAITIGTGVVAVLLGWWPLIPVGFIVGCLVLWREWQRWNPRPTPDQHPAGKGLVRWIESQPNPAKAAQALAENQRYGERVSEVARMWLKHKQSAAKKGEA